MFAWLGVVSCPSAIELRRPCSGKSLVPGQEARVAVLKLNLTFSLRQPILTNVKTQERKE